MDLSGVASSTTSSISDAGTSQAVGIAVLKKAISLQADSASALIAGVSSNTAAPNLPSNLGQNINTTA